MAKGAFGGALVELAFLEVAQKANLFRNLEVLFRRMFDVTGIAVQRLTFEGFFLEMGLVFEYDSFRGFDFLILELFLGVTA